MALFERVKPGKPIKFDAAQWNAILDAAEAYARGELDGDDTEAVQPRPTDIIQIKNTAGAYRNRFDVLGLNGPIITPDDSATDFKNSDGFEGVVPIAGTHERKWAVLLDSLADGGIGRAVLSGTVWVRMTFTHSGDADAGWGEIANGVTTLKNGSTGSARVLWTEASGTTRWARVRIGDGGQEGFIAKLTDKQYTSGKVQYAWTAQSESGTPPVFADGTTSGTFSTNPAYEQNNIDLPIPLIVRLHKGAGDYYWIERPPEWEFVQVTGPRPGDSIYYPGNLMRYDQVGKAFVSVSAVKIISAN